MNRNVCFQWIDPCPNERLRLAQEQLRESVIALGLEPLLYPAGPEMVKFVDILRFARERAKGGSFVWCNSDVVLTRDPYEVEDGSMVHGFHRTEIPSGEICGGVDMYLIPCKGWDEWLGILPPDLWCGATHIDWWLTRAAELRGVYRAHEGFINHITHPTSPASKQLADPYYLHNIKAYNAWALENGAGVFEPKRPATGLLKIRKDISAYMGWRWNRIWQLAGEWRHR